MAEMSPLRRRMIEEMTVRNLSPATQRWYLNAVSKFSRYFGRSPDHLGLEDVHAFQFHLVATGISWPALNQIVCALRFFYGVTLSHSTIPERIAYAREPRKGRTPLTTVYATGLRVSEVVFLKVADINSQRMVIRVEQGESGRDRYVMLSPQLLRIVRADWRLTRPAHWLFPGRDGERPLEPTVLHAACRSARIAAGLSKHVTVHTLRHSFATGCHAGYATSAALLVPALWRSHDRHRGLHARLRAEVEATTDQDRHVMNRTSCERRHLPVPMRWLRAGDGLFRLNHVDQCADCPTMRSKRPPRCPLPSLGLSWMQARSSRRAPTIEGAKGWRSTPGTSPVTSHFD
jgi:integrase